jgi:hypothetical protein
VIFLGVLVAGAAGTLAGLLITDNLATPATMPLQLLGHSLPALDPVAVFCAGLGIGFVFWLGVWMVAAALADRRRHPRWGEPIDTFLPGPWD